MIQNTTVYITNREAFLAVRKGNLFGLESLNETDGDELYARPEQIQYPF